MTGDIRVRVNTLAWTSVVWLFLWCCWWIQNQMEMWQPWALSPLGPVLSAQLSPALYMVIVSFSFKMNKPELMDYFSIQTKHFTVCTQCCLYNLELCFLTLLNLYLLQLLCGLLQQMGGRNHEYHLLGYDTGLCLDQKYSGKAWTLFQTVTFSI